MTKTYPWLVASVFFYELGDDRYILYTIYTIPGSHGSQGACVTDY